MNTTKLTYNLKASDYAIKDYFEKFIYTGNIVLYCSQYENVFFSVLEYVKYNNLIIPLLHTPLASYNCFFLTHSRNHIFFMDKNIECVAKSMSDINYLKMLKIYKGVLYRAAWKELPNLIVKTTGCGLKNNIQNKDYDKYNTYIVLQRNNTNHYEYLFRGDKII